MPVEFKSNVRIKRYTPALHWMLSCIEECSKMHSSFPDPVVITSINDSKHSEGSRHYKDEAVDIRTHNFPDMMAKRVFINTLDRMLNKNTTPQDRFTVLHESIGTPNEHIHVQVKRGLQFP